MSLKIEEIKKISKLARIKLTADEEQKITGDLNKIFAWIDELDEVNTEDVKPMYNVHDGVCPVFNDIVTDGLKVREVTQNAPVPPIHNFFRVPKVIE